MELQKKAVDLTDLAIGILVLGIVVSIGSSILIATRNSRLTDLESVSTINETMTTVTETGETFANTWVTGITNCVNSSNGAAINAANYTLTIDSTSGLGKVTYSGVVSTWPNNTNWKCTYARYNTSRADWTLPNNASLGLAEYGNWFKIIVIVGVAAVILSLIFMSFGKGASSVESTGGSY